jgi:hypothetical protein
MFLGAEFTKIYARDAGIVVYPRSYARFRTQSAAAAARRDALWGAATGLAFALPKVTFTWNVWRRVRRVKRWFKR